VHKSLDVNKHPVNANLAAEARVVLRKIVPLPILHVEWLNGLAHTLRLLAARVGVYPNSRLSLLELEYTAPQACVACDAGFATLEVALGSASPCLCVAL